MSGQRSTEGAQPARAPSVVAIPPAAGALVPFRLGSELRVAVVVKAAFVIVAESPMIPAEAEGIITAEVHNGGSPARSVRLTPDTAPRRPRTDVILTGHAVAPEGQPTRWLPVRLAVFRERALIDKTIYACGDENGSAPFESIPLVYERAYGGLGFADNPLGTGTLELSSRPNLVHPERPEQVACFAPISRAWPSRRRLMGAADRKALDAPVVELPASFDFAYYQAAPADQRVDHLHGDEWVVLEGMSATAPKIRSRLPSARAHVRVYGLAGTPDGAALEPRIDTLRIDADRLGCSLVWRADFVVPSEEALATLRVMVGVECENLPLHWVQEESTAGLGEPASEEVIELDADALIPLSTLTLDEPPGDDAPPPPIVPFVPPTAAESASAGRAPTMVLPAPSLGDTLAVTGDMLAAPPRSLPFVQMAPPPLDTPPPAWSPAPFTPLADAPPPITQAVPEMTPAPSIEAAPAAPPPRAAAATALGIALHNDTPLTLGVVPWGLDPSRDCLAVIVKASCVIVPGEAATLRPEGAPLAVETFAEGRANRVVTYPSDVAPFKVRADVVAMGHAHAPSGSAPAVDVELAFGHEGNAFSRKIKVFGDRHWAPGVGSPVPSEPEHFMALALTWERAFGGKGSLENPAGEGFLDRWRHARKLPALPNLEDPEGLLRIPSQRPAPACFAPRPQAWSALRGPERRSPWSRFPEELDWCAHQIAPRAQQLAFLRGDEPFKLAGMHRAHAVIEGRLPGVRPRCFGLRDGQIFEVTLHLDTVVFDADTLALSLVWRGALPVASEAQPDVAALHLAMEGVDGEGMTLADAEARFPR